MDIKLVKTEELVNFFETKIASEKVQKNVDAKTREIASKIQLPGFRPGKVPVEIVEKKYGGDILAETIELIVRDTLSEAIKAHNLRPVRQPEVTSMNVDKDYKADKDLEFTFTIEVFPEIPDIDYSGIKVSRPKVKIDDEKIDNFIVQLAQQYRTTEPAHKGHKSMKGDVTVIDFEGFLGDVAFEGGRGNDFSLELGSNQFIPGFEDQLVGFEQGDHVTVNVPFPENYGSENLAGKDARFEVDIKEVRVYAERAVDDSLAELLGLENLEELREVVEERMEKDNDERTFEIVKRELLDKLDESTDFTIPPSLLENDFNAIWQGVEDARKRDELDEEDKNKSDDELKEEFRPISMRRVKLGVLINHVAQTNGIEVSEAEINSAIMQRGKEFGPEMQKQYFDYIKKNPDAINEIKSPLLENKTLKFILDKVTVTENIVSEEEMLAMQNAEPATKTNKEKAKKTTAKKAKAAKKSTAKKASSKKAAAKNTATKK